MNIEVLQLAQYEAPKIIEDRKNDWIGYGAKNDYYDWLIERYRNSPTHNTVINNITQLIFGKGLASTNAQQFPNDWAQFISMLSEEEVMKIVSDFYLLGKTNIQCIYNKKHDKVVQLVHMPANLVRPEKCNENGDIEAVYYSDNWAEIRKFPPKRIPMFGTSNAEIEILEIRKYSAGKKYFSDVEYQGCLPYTVLEEEIADYLINVVQNGFSGTKVVNFNNGETNEAKMLEIKNNVKAKLSGSKGDKIITSFNKNVENKTTVDDIPLDNAPEYYRTLSEECTHKILRGHKITSPLLLGIATQNGFSSNADELKNGSILFDNMVIRPLQNVLLSGFQKILNFNQNKTKLIFRTLQPLQFVDLENAQTAEQVKQETGTATQLSLSIDKMNIDSYGEEIDLNEWELIDSRPVDYDHETELDEVINSANNPKGTLLSKMVNLVRTGTAFTRRNSEQDNEVFRTRYRYSGEIGENTRPFCQAMLKANKLYRKEDIIAMGEQVVNEGWGPRGADTYSIWLYKGGGSCHHVWMRETYRRKGTDITSPLAKTVSWQDQKKEGYTAPKNDSRVYQKPVDMPNNGFLPK